MRIESNIDHPFWHLFTCKELKHYVFQTPSFWRVLSRLISRTAEEHPFHALPVLLALANANADEDAANGTLDLGAVKFVS